jgi:hypothetical protein
MQGLSLRAAMYSGADDRQALERLCRYITHPAPANERVRRNATGQLELKLKPPWRDGTMHLAMSPRDFMQGPGRSDAAASTAGSSTRSAPLDDGLVLGRRHPIDAGS